MAIFENASQKQLASQYQRLTQAQQMQMQMEMKEAKMQAAMYNQAAQKGLINPGAILGASGPIQKKERFNPNKSEAYQIPLSRLVAMWQVKYGDAWVDTDVPYDAKDFYNQAYNRLSENQLFERVEGWVRLKENVEKLLADR